MSSFSKSMTAQWQLPEFGKSNLLVTELAPALHLFKCSNFSRLFNFNLPTSDPYRNEALETPQPVAQHSQRRPQVSKPQVWVTPFHVNVTLAIPQEKAPELGVSGGE